ncbi:TPA: hypothetical protein DCX66_00070 [Candidatus Nomurabacteria bacterium]|nr:hypothetical protein [Candidatus Nomurabacteria bacterium]HAX64864.1 hypothetical protein [Candidatus Nomurabacteria bacterium]HCU01616.1 hypothetical protein [Candidatus Nomurabacteria bacterium]
MKKNTVVRFLEWIICGIVKMLIKENNWDGGTSVYIKRRSYVLKNERIGTKQIKFFKKIVLFQEIENMSKFSLLEPCDQIDIGCWAYGAEVTIVMKKKKTVLKKNFFKAN